MLLNLFRLLNATLFCLRELYGLQRDLNKTHKTDILLSDWSLFTTCLHSAWGNRERPNLLHSDLWPGVVKSNDLQSPDTFLSLFFLLPKRQQKRRFSIQLRIFPFLTVQCIAKPKTQQFNSEQRLLGKGERWYANIWEHLLEMKAFSFFSLSTQAVVHIDVQQGEEINTIPLSS